MRPALLLLFFFSCGSPTLGGRCDTACDCTLTTAPIKCVGEWVCNVNKTCEYQCKDTCQTGTVFTCRAEEECNGSICSERKACR
ncbi:MAG: hypothetical protein IPJ65_26550 [Archangiaceae bacterium]|nr:hypothetical protein [Archangiaceae bacterium]